MVIIYSLLTTMLICLIEFIVVKISYICIDWIYTIKENKKKRNKIMTNFEKYKDDLMKIEGSFAFDKNAEKIAGCDTTDSVKSCIDCKDCLFDAGDCFESDKIKWLCEEYEPPILSENELNLIKSISKVVGKEIKYIFRDNRNNMRFFEAKPKINALRNYYSLNKCNISINVMNGDIFPNIQHKDGLYDIENKCFIKE